MLWNNFTKWVKNTTNRYPQPSLRTIQKGLLIWNEEGSWAHGPQQQKFKEPKAGGEKKKTEEMYSNDIQGRTKDLLEVKCVNPWFCSLQMEGKKLSDWGLPPPVIRQTQCLASDCAKPFCCRGEMTWRKVLVQEINSYLHCISHYGIRCYKQEFSS